MKLVLSLFPGIGLLDLAFEQEAERAICLAWSAALIDGEGCITIGKARQGHSGKTAYYRVDVKVSNNNYDLLKPLVVLFGGRIDNVKRNHARKRDGFQWTTTGSAHAAVVIRQAQPFLIAKSLQAGVALRACALLVRKGGTRPAEELQLLEAIKQEMHRLNGRGKEIVCS